MAASLVTHRSFVKSSLLASGTTLGRRPSSTRLQYDSSSGKPSPSRHPKDPASPSSARKTSWSPANSETKATSICRFSLTKESKLFIFSGGWCKLPIDGVCSLIVLLLTYSFVVRRRKKGGDLRPATNKQIISPISSGCMLQTAHLHSYSSTPCSRVCNHRPHPLWPLCGPHRPLTLGNAHSKTLSE